MIRTIAGPDGEPLRIGAYTDLARELGVTNKQIYTWYQRRSRNGFPEPICYRKADTNGRHDTPHFDIDAIRVWLIFYSASPGGWHQQHRNRRP